MLNAQDRAVDLIESYRDPLAGAIARQIKSTVPRYKDEDPPDIKENLAALLGAMPLLIRGQATSDLEEVVNGVASMRASGGFNVGEFTVAALCFLPVLRQFFRDKAATSEEAMEMYEVVEQVALPFVGHIVSAFAGNQPVAAGGIDVKRFLTFLDSPVGIASVEDA
jgi:hypothetical protein